MTNLIANVATLQSSLTRRRSTATLTQALAKAEQEVTTGTRANIYADLGTRASNSLMLRNQISRTESYVDSNTVVAAKMDVMATTMKEMRSITEDLLSVVVSNTESKTTSASELQASALAALEQFIGLANSSYQDGSLFTGIEDGETALNYWNQTSSETGLSPSDVIAGIVGTGPTSAADASSMITQIVSVFDSSNADPNLQYESTFYGGAEALDGSGNPTTRVQARIDDGETISYGVQANDAAFTEIYRGLAMLASIDVSTIEDSEAYSAYVTEAANALSNGINAMLAAETKLGTQQARVESTITSQEDLITIYTTQLDDLEGVDEYEAATRLTQLQTQLETSYTVTSRLSSLSLLNYL
ncbi:flagellin [Albibacillus kandeliae]|uniref:flagellin n=1 Tax=Albibacillus kandeliae TaxID=2174228 RepID=UPI000D6989F4|nr:flagellin [Albibacillus kandeliae]